MKIYAIFLIIGLALWAVGLWLRGFFGIETSPLERKIYWARTAVWFASILLIAWPLQLFRSQLGGGLYLAISIAILALAYWLGILASRALVSRSKAVGP